MSNYKQMRSALITARSALTDLSYSGEVDTETYKAEIDIIDKALALPRRNCDVGTADEQVKRFRAYCKPFIACNTMCRDCPLYKGTADIVECLCKWAQMPYESEVKK